MKESLFSEISKKWLPVISKIDERINGKKKELVYLHKTMLRPEFSIDQRYTTAGVDTTYVAADFVDPNSPLPIKRRDSLEASSGELPTIGMKMVLNRRQINDINLMISRKVASEEVVKKVINDALRCTVGMQEQLEYSFLEGLSNGVVGVLDTNTGRMIRIDYGYKASNMYGASVPWGGNGATPIDDIVRVLSVARGTRYIMLSKMAYNTLRRSRQARELVAGSSGITVVETSQLPLPTPNRFDEAFREEYGVEFIVVDRTVYREVNGKRVAIEPWAKEKVVFLQSDKVGALVYGSLPEEDAEIAGVDKSKPMPYALLRKYSTLEPYTEVTDIMGVVAPIIEGAHDIFVLDIAEAKEVDTNAESSDGGDTKITIAGQAYTKSEVIKALKAIIGGNIPANIGDDKLILKINELSDEDEAKLMEVIKSHKA
ncbi:MAG: major capsid protein [Porphyromonadaceae bacterium]|nr:major capsid protein [Porphyromonadaceae bacterium]